MGLAYYCFLDGWFAGVVCLCRMGLGVAAFVAGLGLIWLCTGLLVVLLICWFGLDVFFCAVFWFMVWVWVGVVYGSGGLGAWYGVGCELCVLLVDVCLRLWVCDLGWC